MVDLQTIQSFLREKCLDGWLLYDFRGSNPIALYLAGLASSGSRRWFLWIPTQGTPVWLIHAIEGTTFRSVNPTLAGRKLSYVGWHELEERLSYLIGVEDGRVRRVAMEYSPDNAIPYISRVDAGTLEMVRRVTGAEIVSSADLVQVAQAVLSAEQIASHRRAAEVCLAAKDAAFAFIRQRLLSGEPVNEFDVQQLIMARFDAAGLEVDHAPIVAVNAFAADPHYAPTADSHNPIQVGDLVLIDLWARCAGDPLACFADITWTAFCGSETPPFLQEIFSLVAAGRDAAIRFIQQRLDAGEPVYGYEVDDVCRGVISRAGYGEHFIHRTGHSLGVTTHFNGVNIDNLETQDRRQLIPGVMFTIEPGIYLPQANFDGGATPKGCGIRSEVNCLMHAGQVEVTTLPLQQEVVALLGTMEVKRS